MKHLSLLMLVAVMAHAEILYFDGRVTESSGLFSAEINQGDTLILTVDFDSPPYEVVGSPPYEVGDSTGFFYLPMTLTANGHRLPFSPRTGLALIDGPNGLYGIGFSTGWIHGDRWGQFGVSLSSTTDVMPSVYGFPAGIPMSAFDRHYGYYVENGANVDVVLGELRWTIIGYGVLPEPEDTILPLNGSFEADSDAWTLNGNVRVSWTPPYTMTGARLIVFNSGDRAPNGSVSQTFGTIPGQYYEIQFDAGVLGFSRAEQRLAVTVQGYNPLESRTFTLFGGGNGTVRWSQQRLWFVADSAWTTLTFRDTSTATKSVDLLLDNVQVTHVPRFIYNGSFEEGYSGWVVSGNQAVSSAVSPRPTDGAKLVVFNNGNSAPDGVLTQSFASIPGTRHTLRFDSGVLAYNRDVQRLAVSVTGNASLLEQSIQLTGTGDGSVRWQSQTFTFQADSDRTTLTFRDASPTTNNIDLLLDHVRID